MASAVELHVGSGQTYSTIRGAVDAAGDGDVIIVHAGSYTEHVRVAKRLTLLGEGADVVTVTAAVTSEHIFYVTADYVNISGFTVTAATGSSWISGFYLDNVEHCNISDNNASNNDNGIHLSHSSDNILMNNTVNSNNDCYGIELYQSSNNTLIGNTASNNRYGIELYHSSNNTLQNNTMSENTYNFNVDGSSSSLSDYIQNVDTSNTVNGKPIYYWVNQKDKQISGDAGFVEVVNSTNITVRNLILTNNSLEVVFLWTNNSRIENVTIDYTQKYGIYLSRSSNNTLTNNNCGISLSGSSDNILANNNCGIQLSGSNNNTLENNIANSVQIRDMSGGRTGIFVYGSDNNNFSGNMISDNWDYGIYLGSSNNNYLEKNTVHLNKCGISLYDADKNIISCNWVYNNRWSGFEVSDSRDNMIEYNNIMSNGQLQSDGSYDCNFDNGRYDVEARNNYWGTTNLTTIDASIYDDDESSYSGVVKFYPPADGPVPCAPGPEIHGDVNHDGKLSTADAVLALQMAVGSIDTDSAADVDSDGKITSLDALMIIQAVAGNIEIG
ncbi:hypothetical protein CW696_02805 [ANME-2 cluster archaeon]|nr:MAG: hypothetical protein CW696_02805 [ANME-2 cluster archaeon]